jgi:enoyl-CoA hydratase/carnithine racemase
MNAFTFAMIDRWIAALEECRRNGDVKAIIVTGSGDSFCTGIDFAELQSRMELAPEERKAELWRGVQRIPLTLEDIDKPVLIAVNGPAVGAGMDLSLMGDIRYASDNARFAETYARVGLVPGAGGAYFLPRLVGPAKALEMFWTAETIDAAEALRLGIVNKVLPRAELMGFVRGFAEKLAKGPQHSIRFIKRLVYQGLRADLRTNLDMVSSHYVVAATSEDHRAAVAKFLERKEPRAKASRDE